jgi:hypothetical protein
MWQDMYMWGKIFSTTARSFQDIVDWMCKTQAYNEGIWSLLNAITMLTFLIFVYLTIINENDIFCWFIKPICGVEVLAV